MKRLLALVALMAVGASLSAEVTETAYKALLNRQVVVVKTDGSEVTGELAAIDDTSIGVIKHDGEVVSVPKNDVREIRAAPSTAQDAERKVANISGGWSKEASLAGYVGAGAVLTFGVLAIVNYYSYPANLVFGGVGTLGTLVMVPVVSVGGHSARTAASPGSVGLRVASWVSYGLSTLNAMGLIGSFLAGYPASVILMVADTALASFSLLAMALDADMTTTQSRQAGAVSRSLTIRPILDVVLSETQGPTLRAGLQASIGL